MSREAEIARFAERWEAARKQWPHAGENPLTVGDELARLLRESQETPGERLKRIADETDEADFENERTDYE